MRLLIWLLNRFPFLARYPFLVRCPYCKATWETRAEMKMQYGRCHDCFFERAGDDDWPECFERETA